MEPSDDHEQEAAGARRLTSALPEFQSARGMLASLAYRLLGSWHDTEDVLQEAYVRWSGVDRAEVLEPRRYLTRVVTRLAIDVLRTRQARRESYLGEWLPEPVPADPFAPVDTSDLSLAVLHLMERLTPPQRAVYVLRTAFVLPYDEIAEILGRSPEDCRQLHTRASKALDREGPRFEPSPVEQQRLLLDFVSAARDGDLARLESMLKESVTEWSDGGGKPRIARKAGDRTGAGGQVLQPDLRARRGERRTARPGDRAGLGRAGADVPPRPAPGVRRRPDRRGPDPGESGQAVSVGVAA
ncbi:sigma-70 family RNA polymerase sigma factor [Kribbella sp. NPDC049174]|uniref:sigma-70 family RNA polymerase sigma factor n=1 Tax=Kribbella sp. NPDC049174 TaxID=3364112 RepID=UPI0037119C0D